MADTNPTDRAWEIINEIGFCMFVTGSEKGIRSRPMSATVDRDEHAVYFLANVEDHKDDEIRANPHVELIFADPGSHRYAHVKGVATVSNDRAKIHELWSPFAKAWFDGEDDPRIRVLKVSPQEAEYWDTPGKIATYAAMLTAAVTGGRPDVGDNRTARM